MGKPTTIMLIVQIDLHEGARQPSNRTLERAVARVINLACETDIVGAECLDHRIGRVTVMVK